MTRHAAFMLLATLLAGCTTASHLRDSQATAMYRGNGSVQDIAACVSAAWSQKPVHLVTNVLYGGTTIEIHMNDRAPAVALVDIKPVSDKTVASYYSSFKDDDSWYFEQIDHCVTATPAPN
ncbi:MAG TPA: hypothetical protein VFG49_05260 [Dyella sp.]|uniref:hypothetical protein n=1 Tax=Dyella sp. TaxID=1869338 RepID=UPI002D79EDC1|nr:hypothetical protein [Dyella sp.]HET6552930.1 hypothetical protein [Dyella sp.]